MLKQSLNFKLSQKLSPQQIQLMKMIQLPTQAFEERLKQEIEENPALDTGKEETDDFEGDLENEFDDDGTEKIDTEDINIDDYLSDDEIPNYKTQANNYSSDDEEKQVPYAAGKTFHQSLREQLNTFSLSDEENAIAEFLVGSIDDSGYLRRDLDDLVDDLAFTQNFFTTVDKIEKVLVKVVQTLDPIGVGARDLKECLIIQLKSKSSTDVRVLAINILETAFDKFVKKHYNKLLEKFDINEEIVRLKNHLIYFKTTLNESQIEKGKKLTFISQELGREINTIGSKSNNLPMQQAVVEMKNELEKIKEQLLNVL